MNRETMASELRAMADEMKPHSPAVAGILYALAGAMIAAKEVEMYNVLYPWIVAEMARMQAETVRVQQTLLRAN